MNLLIELPDKTLDIITVLKRKLKEDSLDFVINKALNLLYVMLKTCEDKKKFKNMKQASATCQNLKESGMLTKDHHPYKCPFCNKIHIGRSFK